MIWIKNPLDKDGKPVKDIKNTNDKLKTKPVLNSVIIKDLIYNENQWSGGTVYDPNVGKIYDCTIWFEDGKFILRGYIGWFYETKTWTRIK